MSRPLFLAICLLLSGIVFGIFIRQPQVNRFQAAMFLKMVQGTAPKPYVQRVLLPVTVRLIAAATPAGTRAATNEWLQGRRSLQRILDIRRWDPEYAFEHAVGMALMYLSLVGFAYALRHFFTGVFRAPGVFADSACLVALLGVPPFFRYYSHVYDLPNLLLFALALALMVRRRWGLFLLVLAAATLNKETAVLLTMLFVIHFWNEQRMDRRSFTRLVLLQACIFVSFQLAISWAFRNNPGPFLYVHLFDHNIGSQRVLEKNGFKLEGILRKAKKIAGKFYDDRLYAKVKR